jgi:hypothetical protein
MVYMYAEVPGSRVAEGSCQVLKLLLVDKILAVFQAAARITKGLYEGKVGIMSEVCAARITTMKEKMTALLRLSAARITKQGAL